MSTDESFKELSKQHTEANVDEEIPRVVVRIKRSYAHAKKTSTITMYTAVRIQRRLCRGHNFFEDDVEALSATVAVESISNLDNVDDGLYEIIYKVSGGENDTEETYQYLLIPFDDVTQEKEE